MSKVAFFVEMEAWPCLIAGGNRAACAKAEVLVEAGAQVSVWSKEFEAEFLELERKYAGQIALFRGDLDVPMLQHILLGQAAPRLVVISTGEASLDEDLFALCEEQRVAACLPGYNARLEFAATIARGALHLAVSAETAPELQEKLAAKMEREIPKDWTAGSQDFVAWRYSPEIQNMHPDLSNPRRHALAANLIECRGRFAAAQSKTERSKEGRWV